jgi:hypothetical protein
MRPSTTTSTSQTGKTDAMLAWFGCGVWCGEVAAELAVVVEECGKRLRFDSTSTEAARAGSA